MTSIASSYPRKLAKHISFCLVDEVRARYFIHEGVHKDLYHSLLPFIMLVAARSCFNSYSISYDNKSIRDLSWDYYVLSLLIFAIFGLSLGIHLRLHRTF